MPFMNIPYELDERLPAPPCRFKSIWKVHADNTYQVPNPSGFAVPGIFVTFEGKGTISLAENSYDLDPGTYMIVPHHIPCAYRCLNDDWKFYFIHFDTLDMALHLELPIGEVITTAKIPEAARLSERLIDSLIVESIGYRYRAHLMIQELLLLFAGEQLADGPGRHPELDNILYQMHKNIGQTIPVEDWVRQSGLSRTVFFSRFRSRTGMSPSRYMQELKLASAKTALETTDASVKEIAAALQFYDEFHFSKLFKQRYGVSPRGYRQHLGR